LDVIFYSVCLTDSGFGQTTSSGSSLFGQQSQSGGLFGSAGNKTTFGTTTTTASTGFGGFGGGGTTMFGQNTGNKVQMY